MRNHPRGYLFPRAAPSSAIDVSAYVSSSLAQLDSGQIGLRLATIWDGWRAARVLDLGCGPGIWALALAQCQAAEVVCQDNSQPMLDCAREIHQLRDAHVASYQRRDLTDMPYPNESFDAVICSVALYYSSDEAYTIRHVARVLRPGGIFFLSCHSWRWMLTRYQGHGARRLAGAVSPLLSLILGWKVAATPYTWFAATRRRCARAGLALQRRFDNGHEPTFQALFVKA